MLGPTLFAAFVNYLTSCLSSSCKLYADDLKIIAKVESEVYISNLQADLDALSLWCTTWLMEPNIEKCKVMNIGCTKDIGDVRTYSLRCRSHIHSHRGRTRSRHYSDTGFQVQRASISCGIEIERYIRYAQTYFSIEGCRDMRFIV